MGHLVYCADGIVALAAGLMDPDKARVAVREHVRGAGNRCSGCRSAFWPCFEATAANYAIGVTLQPPRD